VERPDLRQWRGWFCFLGLSLSFWFQRRTTSLDGFLPLSSLPLGLYFVLCLSCSLEMFWLFFSFGGCSVRAGPCNEILSLFPPLPLFPLGVFFLVVSAIFLCLRGVRGTGLSCLKFSLPFFLFFQPGAWGVPLGCFFVFSFCPPDSSHGETSVFFRSLFSFSPISCGFIDDFSTTPPLRSLSFLFSGFPPPL